MKPSRPALRYHGSKWKLASWIISHFPPHECYVEAFGGGAGVLLQKPRSWLEIYNDLDTDIVNYFHTLRSRPDELIRAIELTPYAKKEWELSLQRTDDPLERARRTYIRAYMAIAGPTAQWRTGWRRQKMITKENNKKKMTPAPIVFMKTDHLYAAANRLRGVQIECDDALAVIARFDSPETLFYLDPPYVAATRTRWKKHAYAHEMTDDQHQELARVIHSLQGMVILSGYRCALYDQLYAEWQRRDTKARCQGPLTSIESLWLSPSAIQKMQNAYPLFAIND